MYIRILLGVAAVVAEFSIGLADPRFGIAQFIFSVVLFGAVVVPLGLFFRWPHG